MGNYLHSKTEKITYEDINGRMRSAEVGRSADHDITVMGYTGYHLSGGVEIFISRSSDTVVFADN